MTYKERIRTYTVTLPDGNGVERRRSRKLLRYVVVWSADSDSAWKAHSWHETMKSARAFHTRAVGVLNIPVYQGAAQIVECEEEINDN